MSEESDIEYKSSKDYEKERQEKQANLVKAVERAREREDVNDALESVGEVGYKKTGWVERQKAKVKSFTKENVDYWGNKLTTREGQKSLIRAFDKGSPREYVRSGKVYAIQQGNQNKGKGQKKAVYLNQLRKRLVVRNNDPWASNPFASHPFNSNPWSSGGKRVVRGRVRDPFDYNPWKNKPW